MKPIIKKIVQEMLDYVEQVEFKETDLYIKRADEKMGGFPGVGSRISEITRWMDPYYGKILKFNIQELNLYLEGTDNEYVYNEFVKLFNIVPELNEFLMLKESTIVYSESLSEDEISEIRQYVFDNTERFRRRY